MLRLEAEGQRAYKHRRTDCLHWPSILLTELRGEAAELLLRHVLIKTQVNGDLDPDLERPMHPVLRCPAVLQGEAEFEDGGHLWGSQKSAGLALRSWTLFRRLAMFSDRRATLACLSSVDT